MLTIILTVILAGIFIVAVRQLLQRDTKKDDEKPPGLGRAHKRFGNVPEIGAAGSFHEFLVKLHGDHGSIASFWFFKTYCVSVADAELLKEMRASFDRPPLLYKSLEPLITEHSLQFANGEEGRARRNATDKCFGAAMLDKFCYYFNEVAQETVSKLKSLPSQEHIPLCETTLSMAIKGLTFTSFGNYFKDDNNCLEFKKNHEICWHDMELRLDGSEPTEGSDRQKLFEEAKRKMNETVRKVIHQRKLNPPRPDERAFIDELMDNKDLYTEPKLFADAVLYMIGGFHTSGNLLAWAIYYLSINNDIAEKAYQQVMEVVGKDEPVTPNQVKELRLGVIRNKFIGTIGKGNAISITTVFKNNEDKYLRQIMDETMRVSILAPTAARVHSTDIRLGRYTIPKQTPIIHALGVCLQDENSWPNPEKFDPERFSPENEKARHTYGFVPFGIGKRKCPGYRFAYYEITVFLAILIRSFKWRLAEGQVVKKKYGFVTCPTSEVWVRVEKRV